MQIYNRSTNWHYMTDSKMYSKRIINIELCRLWRRWVYRGREKGREKDSIRWIIILYEIGKRGIRIVPGCNPISDLISEILNARDASWFDRSARTNTSQMERKVEKYRKGRSRLCRTAAPDCRGQKSFCVAWLRVRIDRPFSGNSDD